MLSYFLKRRTCSFSLYFFPSFFSLTLVSLRKLNFPESFASFLREAWSQIQNVFPSVTHFEDKWDKDNITGLQLNSLGGQHDTVLQSTEGLLYLISLFINPQNMLLVLNLGLVLKG